MGEVALLVQYGGKKVQLTADLSWSIRDLKKALVEVLEEDLSKLPRMRILSKGMYRCEAADHVSPIVVRQNARR